MTFGEYKNTFTKKDLDSMRHETIAEKFWQAAQKAAEERLKTNIMDLIMDDSYAITFQTMSQYRSGLIKNIEKLQV